MPLLAQLTGLLSPPPFPYLQNMSYDHLPNKVYMVKKGGLQRILTTMAHHPEVLEVQRLCLGVLYNTLQEVPDRMVVNVGQMRAVALSHPLVEVVETALRTFEEQEDINLMARQLLAITEEQRMVDDIGSDDDDDDNNNDNDNDDNKGIRSTPSSPEASRMERVSLPYEVESVRTPEPMRRQNTCDMTQPLSPVAAF